MVSCSIFGREMKLQGSPVTLVEYHREFSCDLMQDLVKAYSQGFINSAIILQIAWAMARTHDKETPAFEIWIKEFDAEKFNLVDADFLEVVDSAINAELFCGGATRKSRIKGWFKRLLERISKYFGRLANGF
jgi:hypothetical protein